MKLGIHGYYGYGNLGDDLMLYLLIERLCQQHGPEVRFRVLYTGDAEPQLIRWPGGADVELHRVDTWPERFAAVGDCDALIFGGGTCLHRFGFCGLYNNLAAKLRGTPVIWLGVGADDVGRGLARWKARAALRTCAAISVRDSPSADIVRQLLPNADPVAVYDDLAFLLLRSPTLALQPTPGDDRRNTLCVGWRDFTGYLSSADQDRALRHAARELADIAARHGFHELRIIDVADRVDHDTDSQLGELLEPLCPVPVVHDVGRSMEDKVRCIANSRAAVFARLHGLFLAKVLGTPCVGVAYASKVESFGKHLNRPAICTLRDVVNDSSQLTRLADQEWQRPAEFLEPVEQLVGRAEQHLDFLDQALKAA